MQEEQAAANRRRQEAADEQRAAELQLDQRQRYLHTVESELNDVTSKHAAEKMELMRVRGEMRERMLGQVIR